MGTNIEKIKEQGNQAAPLLTELHDNELVIEFDGFGGVLPSLTISNLRGRKNILKYWGKVEMGELDARDIKVIVRSKSTQYQVANSVIECYETNNAFSVYFFVADMSGSVGLAIVEIKYLFSKSTGKNDELTVKDYQVTTPETKYNVTAEFID